jgi:hypothetical protein
MKFTTAFTILSATLSWSSQSTAFSTVLAPSRRQTTVDNNRLYSSTLTKEEEITSVNGIATTEEKQDTATVTMATPSTTTTTTTTVAVAVDSVPETIETTKPVTVMVTATPATPVASAAATTTTTTSGVAKMDKNKIQP